MAIKKISEFVSATPTSEDKILFEHNGAGKSATISDVGRAMGVPTKTSQLTNDSGFITGNYLPTSGGIISSPSYQYGKVEIGVDGESGYVELYNQNRGKANNSAHLDMYDNLFRVIKKTADGGEYIPFQVDNEQVLCTKVTGAVFNDLADAIPVGEGDVLEAGYCYGFDGEHYTKTSEYMQKSYIGIHSDTYGFKMGHEEGKEKLNVAVSGFVLAHVDREYEVGTPLTCTEDGYLTEIELEDKIKYPERVVATYWKSEPNEEWGSEDKKIKVKGRRWVKIK